MIITLSDLRSRTGLALVAAEDTYSRQTLPETLDPAYIDTYRCGSWRTLNYEELQDRAASPHHLSMCRYAVAHYTAKKYCVYPNGVGIEGIQGFVDFAACCDDEILFGECLTVKTMLREGMLEHKMQFAHYGTMCIVVPQAIMKHDTIVQKLVAISRDHSVFIYSETGLGARRNHLTEIHAYCFFHTSSCDLPPLTVTTIRRSNYSTMSVTFSGPIPPAIKEIELKETWRAAFEHSLIRNREFIALHAIQKFRFKSYHLKFKSNNSAWDLLSIRIKGKEIDITYRGEWGKTVFNDLFLEMFTKKGIETELKEFLH